MRKNNIIKILILSIITVAIALYFIKKNDNLRQEISPIQNISLRLKWTKYSSFAHHFIADNKAIDTKNGIELDIKEGGVGIDPIKSVASGNDDIGLASYGQILLAREKGIPVIAIGEEYITSGAIILSLKGKNITKPKDLEGKKVGVIPGSDTYTVYRALMSKEKVDISKIMEIPVGFDLKPLLAGTIDATSAAFITNQPIFVKDQGFEISIINPKDYGVNIGGNVFFTTEDNIKNKKNLLIKFLKTEIEGINTSQTLKDEEIVDTVMVENPILKKNTEIKIWEATKEYLLQKDKNKIGIMPEETWKNTFDIFYKFDILKTNIDFKKAYTNELILEAYKK